jgi:hypothetical protein
VRKFDSCRGHPSEVLARLAICSFIRHARARQRRQHRADRRHGARVAKRDRKLGDRLLNAPLAPDVLLAAQIAALQSIMPPIDAFAVSGSYGRETSDRYSDLDFLLLVADEDFWAFADEFPSLISHPCAVISEGLGRFNSDYGFGYFYLLDGGNKVDYYVNAPRTMSPLPLSARANIVEDRSGYLTERLGRARREYERDVRPHVAEGVHQCLIGLHDLRKHASRHDLLPMLWKLEALRRPALALHHVAAGDVYAPSGAVARLSQRLPAEPARRVAATVPTLDPASIATAFEGLRAIMLDSWQQFAELGVPTPQQFELERTLSEDIIQFLRGVD